MPISPGRGPAPVPTRGGATPACAQSSRREHRAPGRGGLHPPLRLDAQCPSALRRCRHRRRVRRRRRSSTATATSARRCARPLAGNFRGGREGRQMADSASSLAPTERLLSPRNGRRIRRAQDREGSTAADELGPMARTERGRPRTEPRGFTKVRTVGIRSSLNYPDRASATV